MFNRKFPTVMT